MLSRFCASISVPFSVVRDAASTFNAVTRGNLPVSAFSWGGRCKKAGQIGKASPCPPSCDDLSSWSLGGR
jgi:hypothetical protein